MNHSDQVQRTVRQNGIFPVLAIAMTVQCHAPNSASAQVEISTPSGARVATATRKHDGVWLYGVTFKLQPPRKPRTRYLELAVGSISSRAESRAFISLGPVWRMPGWTQRCFLEFGFSPTLLTGAYLNGRDLGGNLHFTSSLTIGSNFGAQDKYGLALRAQHMSNAGLNDSNPGLDTIGLNFTVDLSKR